MSVENFGVLSSINSLGIILGAFFGVVPYVMSKYVIEFKNNVELSERFLWDAFRFTAITMCCLLVCVLIFAPELKSYLKLSDYTPIFIFLVYLASGVLMSVFFGVMQGLLLYVQVSIKGALVAFLRLILAIVLVVVLGYGYNGALLAAMLANIAIAFWAYSVVTKHISLTSRNSVCLPPSKYKEIFVYSIPIALTWVFISVMTNVDVVLVKHYTSEVEAGEYSVAAIIARIAVFLPGVLLSLLFPQVLQDSSEEKGSASTLITVMGLTVLLSVGFAGIVYLIPSQIISILFGEKYVAAAQQLVVITFAMALISIISVIFNFLLAKKIYNYLYMTSLIIALFSIYVYLNPPTSSLQVAYMIFYAALAILLGTSLFVFSRMMEAR